MFKIIYVYFLIVLLMAGCASLPGMPGYIEIKKSSFDGSTHVSMEPALVYRGSNGFSGSDIKFSLLWSSSMSDEVVLFAQVAGAKSINTGKSLFLDIDGEVVGLKTLDSLTNIETKSGVAGAAYVPASNVSFKRYSVTKEFIQRLLDAKLVKVKLELSDGYHEGIFTDTTTSSAFNAFKDFVGEASKHGY